MYEGERNSISGTIFHLYWKENLGASKGLTARKSLHLCSPGVWQRLRQHNNLAWEANTAAKTLRQIADERESCAEED
jgi:hypothetical protein